MHAHDAVHSRDAIDSRLTRANTAPLPAKPRTNSIDAVFKVGKRVSVVGKRVSVALNTMARPGENANKLIRRMSRAPDVPESLPENFTKQSLRRKGMDRVVIHPDNRFKGIFEIFIIFCVL